MNARLMPGHLALGALALCLTALALFSAAACTRQGVGGNQESVYERVERSGTIRAAYVVYPPSLIKDPNSGEISGISADVMRRVAEDLGLRLEWTEEVGWSTMIEGLETNRYDVVVSGIWPNASRARHVDFSIPLFYSGIGAYVRAGDTRFSSTLGNVNNANVRIATIDGEMSDIIARTQFPNAQRISLPQISDVSQMLLNVKSNRADITFVEPAVAYDFIRNNRGSIRNIRPGDPVRVFGNSVMFRRGQYEFGRMLNTSIEVLLNSGEVDRIVDRYEPEPGAFYRVAAPYAVSPAPRH